MFARNLLYLFPIGILIIGSYFAVMLKPHSFSWLVATVVNIYLGIFVYLKNKENNVNRAFALVCIACALWTLDVFGMYIAPNESFALYWLKAFRIGPIFVSATVFHFILALTRNINKKGERLIYAAYMIGLIFIILNWMGVFGDEVIKRQWKYAAKMEPLFIIFLLNFTFWMIYGFIYMFHSYRTTMSIRERNQLKYFLAGAVIGTIFGLVPNVLIILGMKIYPVGGFANIAYTSFIAYAIVKHQLMDIRIVIRRSVVYGSLTAAIAGGYFLILSAFTLLFQNMAGRNVLATIVFALIIVFAFQPLRDKIQKITDRLFFKDKYDYQKTLRGFSRGLSSIIELDRLSILIMDKVTRTMHIDKGSLLLRDEKSKGFKISLAKGLEEEKVRDINLSLDNQLIRTLSNKGRRILNKEEIEVRLNEDSRLREDEEKRKEFEAIKREMDQLEAMLSIPLVTKNRLIGIFNLGVKKSEDAFTSEDIGLLSTIANQAATAIENAQLYTERREMEKALHQRDKMAALGTLASSIAHEIKNPLTPIKTFIQLLPRKFDDLNFRNKFNAVIPQEIERLDNVLQQLMNFSRPSEGKWHPVDVQKAVDEILLLMKGELSKHGVKVIKKYEDVPEITADGEQLKQVFMNLILNAAHAMPGGGTLTISTRLLAKTENQKLKTVEVSFTDTGCGIPPEALPRLFDAFFTTKEKGTGLGLAISRRIIKDHNGTIDVKSEVGKSTTFIINLPLTQEDSTLRGVKRGAKTGAINVAPTKA